MTPSTLVLPRAVLAAALALLAALLPVVGGAAPAAPGPVAQPPLAAAAPPTAADCDGPWQTVLRPAATPAPAARAVWLDATRLRWPGAPAGGHFRLLHAADGGLHATPGAPAHGVQTALTLRPDPRPLPPATAERVRWLAAGPTLAVKQADRHRLADLHRGQLLLVQEDDAGRVLQATGVQHALALDALYAAATRLPGLGVTSSAKSTRWRLWAPTAQAVWLCLHPDGRAPASALLPMSRDAHSGSWQALRRQGLAGHTYTYLVDVWVPGAGIVRNRVTDPYSLSLNADSQRSWIGNLDDPALQPEGWRHTPRPATVRGLTDLVVYELHLRDFSIRDASVRPAWRGTYLAFAEPDSDGMRHLRAMAAAGLTDVHLLPVFDIASIPETGCSSPDEQALRRAAPDGPAQQAAVKAGAAADCYNWGYDPLHYGAPEGSYATRADDGAVRILEFRRMVQALHAAGLRVGMDVVYNHTPASGQHPHAVLDRTVPGYYQRLNADGAVETSTCCANTATEHAMMERLMIDTAVRWVRDHGIDSFRFDLMGHQPRAAMQRLQRAVDAAAGHRIHLMGEGWNFGEVKDHARFVQASQQGLPGSGIASFSDRGRDAARGGGCCDDPAQTLARTGWLNHRPDTPRDERLRGADLLRGALAGTLAVYQLHTHDGRTRTLAEIDYAGQPAGFAAQPGEVVNYVENHDNQTLYDINVIKLARDTSPEDRARVQVLGLALTAFSQGVAYFHAGVEALRSKSGDRNSFDSGDWFNRMDWRFFEHAWGSGLPPEQENAAFWPLLQPLLADPALRATPEQMRFTRDAFLDLLKIRAGSTLLRLPTTQAVQQRLTMLGTGPDQNPALLAAHLDGRGWPGASYAGMLVMLNADVQPARLALPALRGQAWRLHPVQAALTAADPRPREQAHWNAEAGEALVPPRTAVVWVLDEAGRGR